MITETLISLMRRSMREASLLQLQFVPEHSRFLDTPTKGRRRGDTKRTQCSCGRTKLLGDACTAFNDPDCNNNTDMMHLNLQLHTFVNL